MSLYLIFFHNGISFSILGKHAISDFSGFSTVCWPNALSTVHKLCHVFLDVTLYINGIRVVRRVHGDNLTIAKYIICGNTEEITIHFRYSGLCSVRLTVLLTDYNFLSNNKRNGIIKSCPENPESV